MKNRVLVVGCANIDFVQRMRRLPFSGETTVEEAGYSYMPGGSGSVTAVAFSRLGMDTILCTRVGGDSNGVRLRRIYENLNIDSRFVVSDVKHSTALASVLVEEDGKSRTIIYPGATSRICRADVEEAFTTYPDALFMALSTPEEAVMAGVEFARDNGTPVFIDADQITADYPVDKLGRVEVFLANETEARVISGITPSNAENCLRACIRISGMMDVKHIVLKLGERGSYVYDGKYYHIIPACNTHPVDTTSSGDVYSAALTYWYLNRGDIYAAARFATYASGLCISREGGYTSIPKLGEIRSYIEALKAHKGALKQQDSSQ